MAISHFVSYKLDMPDRITEAQLKEVALRLRAAVAQQSFITGDMFGSAVDSWGFSIETPEGDILVDVSPPQVMMDGNWHTQVMQQDPGLFRKARLKRFAELKRVEWAVHKALLSDALGARDLAWDVDKGAFRRPKTQPTP